MSELDDYDLMARDREFWIAFRHALLMMVGAIEKILDIEPTTSSIRKWAKASYPNPIAIKAKEVQTKILEIETEV